jgi:hypothetical protein
MRAVGVTEVVKSELGQTGTIELRGDDEIVELEGWDAVRVPPGTWRGYEAGPEGLEILVIGAPNLGRLRAKTSMASATGGLTRRLSLRSLRVKVLDQE